MPFFTHALIANKDALSPQALAEIRGLSGPRPLAFWRALLMAWVVIAASIWLAGAINAWWCTAAAVVIIGTRQNVLGLLVHEQAHLGHGGKYGDWVANLLAAYPMLVLTLDGYAPLHLTHHREFATAKDPDYTRKSGPDWTFPMSRARLALLFVTDLLGLNALKLISGKKSKLPFIDVPRPNAVPKWVRPAFYALLAGVITATGTWTSFLLFWVLPLLTVLPALVRWGAICEHDYNVHSSALKATPVIIQGPVERLLVPYLNFGMHLYHHQFPNVTWSLLPRVHQIFEREGLVNSAGVYRGSLAFLRTVVAGISMNPSEPAADSSASDQCSNAG